MTFLNNAKINNKTKHKNKKNKTQLVLKWENKFDLKIKKK